MQSTRSAQASSSWFRSHAGRRYGRDFAWLIVIKLVLLTLLYFIFVAPQPRMDTSPATIRKRFSSTSVPVGGDHKASIPDRALEMSSL